VDRRRFLLTSLAVVLAAPLAAEGQQALSPAPEENIKRQQRDHHDNEHDPRSH
jgi:hypothetical protein